MTTILDEKTADLVRRLLVAADGIEHVESRAIRRGVEQLCREAAAALATPSTGAVGEPVAFTHQRYLDSLKASGGEGVYAVLWDKAYDANVPLYAAPPSSPSERDAALEEAAKVAESHRESGRRSAVNATNQIAEISWNSAAAEAGVLAEAIRRLKASRSDTVGPEAGE
jgi:hypothetical protein